MKKYYYFISIIVVVGFCFTTVEANEKDKESEVNSMKELQSLFMNPPIEYGSAPLWVWNDNVTEEQIDQQLIDFKEGGMGGVFIHPRPGLLTSYLSDEWFSLCAYTVKKGKELGMNVWLYDENSYPSGFAGGHVPAEMPESYNQGGGLVLNHVEKLPDNAGSYLLILKQVDTKFVDITNKLNDNKNKKGNYFLYEKSFYRNQAWHGGYSYVDLLHEGVTEKFIEVTMTGYKKYLGNEFGKVVPGIFTDEPNVHPPGGTIRWTPLLFQEFQKRWGYDLKINLPSLTHEIGNWKQVRHNYYTTILEMFIERWSKPWNKYCEENNLDWTGHYWEHGWPDPQHGGDNMAMYAWHQMPAIDILMNQYSEDVNAQFGNVRAVKELSSVANQMGQKRTLSETYGAGGWDLRFEDMKRIGDWEYVLGVNFMNQHLSYMTLEGARKRDHPQSFSYHEPWWKNYKVLGDYFSRLSLALSSGKQNNRILVFEPTSTAWSYFSPANSHEKFSEIGPVFQNFVFELEKYQIEYDLASENIVKDIGDIRDNKFVVGERAYDVIIIPPGLENLDKPTYELFKEYLREGGKVISFNNVPSYIDGSESTELKSIVEKYSKQWVNVKSLSETKVLEMLTSNDIRFVNPENIKGKLFHHRRDLDDGQILFLVNTSMDEWSTGSLFVKGKTVNELDLTSGELKPFAGKMKDGSLEISFDLPPSGSLLLSIGNESQGNLTDKEVGEIKFIISLDEVKIKNETPNVLTIDYCDIKLNGKIEKDIYFFNAADKVFKHHGFDSNPWVSAVQYKTSIIDRNKFADDSGFEASYNFTVDEGVNHKSISVVIEHPELWQLLINNTRVELNLSEYWLDRKFGVYNIGENINVGINQITLIASPMTVYSELEPIYIIGDFGLEAIKKGWKLVKEKPLKLGSWREQGLPFYSDAVSYKKSYLIKLEDKRYVVKLPDWLGSVAEVKVNNKSAGIIAWPPFELDITDQIKEGENEITIDVAGTLKNLLGPHHIGVVRGSAWPASFESALGNMPSGSDYDFIDYGLFKDFVLIESEGPPKKVYWKIEYVSKPQFASVDSITFNSNIEIVLLSQTEGAEIRYTLDGSEPNNSSTLYTKPIKIDESTSIKMQAFKSKAVPSPIVQRNFYILDKEINGLYYKYYEGTWMNIPDFNSLTKISSGHIFGFNLDSFERRDSKFAVEFSGYLKIKKDGEYNFYVASNDGSRLFIGDNIVIDNDGLHSNFERQGEIVLKAGIHPIKLQYFDGGGSHSLNMFYKGPGVSRQAIPLDKLMYQAEED